MGMCYQLVTSGEIPCKTYVEFVLPKPVAARKLALGARAFSVRCQWTRGRHYPLQGSRVAPSQKFTRWISLHQFSIVNWLWIFHFFGVEQVSMIGMENPLRIIHFYRRCFQCHYLDPTRLCFAKKWKPKERWGKLERFEDENPKKRWNFGWHERKMRECSITLMTKWQNDTVLIIPLQYNC